MFQRHKEVNWRIYRIIYQRVLNKGITTLISISSIFGIFCILKKYILILFYQNLGEILYLYKKSISHIEEIEDILCFISEKQLMQRIRLIWPHMVFHNSYLYGVFVFESSSYQVFHQTFFDDYFGLFGMKVLFVVLRGSQENKKHN